MTISTDAPKPRRKMIPVLLTLLTVLIITSMSYALYAIYLKTRALQQQQSDTTIAQVNLTKQLAFAVQERWYQNNDWLLLKARYYLELAEINAHWSEDTQTTAALFQQADMLLANLHEPQLFAIRQEISREIALIQSTPTIDIAGLLSQLDAAQHLVATQQPKNPFTPPKSTPSADKNTASPSTWREHLQSSLHLLEKLVVIRHHNDAIQSMLTPEYNSIVRENIQLNLQEAQWAVLQKNQTVYQLTLTQAIDKINQLFDQNAPATQALVKQLRELQTTQLNTPSVATGQSLLLLNQWIQTKKSPVMGENS